MQKDHRKKFFIFSHSEPVFEKEAVLFRKKFRYDNNEKTVIGITADTRYLLYVNGETVCRGPESGDSFRKYYDRIDITDFLHQGENCIAVKVIHYPVGDEGIRPFDFGAVGFVRSVYGGLCVFCAEGNVQVETDTSWKWKMDNSYSFKLSKKARQAGDTERINADQYPQGWISLEYDDSEWENAKIIQEADENVSASKYGVLANWMLHERDIPLEELIQVYPVKIYSEGKEAEFHALNQDIKFEIPSFSAAEFVIDMGRLVTAYVRSDYVSGNGAEIEYLYSECFYQEKNGELCKIQRDDWKNGILDGETDELKLGKQAFVYEPFEYRTFRYLRVRIQAQETKVVLNGISFWTTSYPFHSKAIFASENPLLEEIWETSLYTLKCCMHDTYIDCPYYERLQYVMDTMIEAQNTYLVLGDDRLAKKALLDFASTQMADGMIYCQAPTTERHVIPGFGIYFIDMLCQHYWYFKDAELVKKYWHVCAGILQYFQNHMRSDGEMMEFLNAWEFVDWTKEWRNSLGTPYEGKEGEKQYLYMMMYAYGLSKMAEMTKMVYGCGSEVYWAECLDTVRKNIQMQAWDSKEGYYRTSNMAEQFSQHAQVWAVLSGCIKGEAANALMRKTAEDETLIQCSYSMKYYYNRAMEAAGVDCADWNLWNAYEKLLNSGCTTWPEDPIRGRSDCHGWSTTPVFEFAHTLLGIKPKTPGFEEILIEPMQMEMGNMKGEIWTPGGMVHVEREVQQGETPRVKLFFRFETIKKVTVRINGKVLLDGYYQTGQCCTE